MRKKGISGMNCTAAIRTAIQHYESKMKESPQYTYTEEMSIIRGLYEALKIVEKYYEILNFIKVR